MYEHKEYFEKCKRISFTLCAKKFQYTKENADKEDQHGKEVTEFYTSLLYEYKT